MAEAQSPDIQPGKEPVEKSLKPFSDADIIGELSRRLHANPKLDPSVLEKFDTVTAEIKKKLTPEEPKADLKQVEVQAPSESEGKKWAEILRKEGAGVLEGKFRKSWTFINPSGKEEQVSGEENPFTTGGAFGDIYLMVGAIGNFDPDIKLSDFKSINAERKVYTLMIIVKLDKR